MKAWRKWPFPLKLIVVWGTTLLVAPWLMIAAGHYFDWIVKVMQ